MNWLYIFMKRVCEAFVLWNLIDWSLHHVIKLAISLCICYQSKQTGMEIAAQLVELCNRKAIILGGEI